ncbi:MAG: hypothetical protein FJY25_18265 [Betaproteobacteria bacterium]|nr:hypothetical protein [Betaproteobacteria bacterium]
MSVLLDVYHGHNSACGTKGQCHTLAIDEIQKIPRWSEVVKGLWDADRAEQHEPAVCETQ